MVDPASERLDAAGVSVDVRDFEWGRWGRMSVRA